MLFLRFGDSKAMGGASIPVQERCSKCYSLTLTSSPSSPIGTYLLLYFPEVLT